LKCKNQASRSAKPDLPPKVLIVSVSGRRTATTE
jgi:hypothetical protein